jgi:hypothetical protein
MIEGQLYAWYNECAHRDSGDTWRALRNAGAAGTQPAENGNELQRRVAFAAIRKSAPQSPRMGWTCRAPAPNGSQSRVGDSKARGAHAMSTCSIHGPDTEAQDLSPPLLISGLQRTAGPYRWVIRAIGRVQRCPLCPQ